VRDGDGPAPGPSEDDGAALPSVIIAIPARNAAGTISDTLASLRAQTYPHVRVVVVDNASTDDTAAVVAREHPWASLRRHSKAVDAEGNFQRCFELAAEADLLAIYHADDVYEPTIVEREVQVLRERPDVGIVFSQALTIGDDGQVVGRTPRFREHLPDPITALDFGRVVRTTFETGNVFVCPSALGRREVWLRDVAVWDGEQFGTAADVDVWLRAARRWTLAIITEPLMRYRLSATQGTAQYLRNRTSRRDFLKVLEAWADDPAAGAVLTDEHRRGLRRAEYCDDVARAANALALGRDGEANQLLRQFPVLGSLHTARVATAQLVLLLLLTLRLRRAAGALAVRLAGH
jgi:glycosyltransferase involved in cell wall biosynthesis